MKPAQTIWYENELLEVRSTHYRQWRVCLNDLFAEGRSECK
jgi:hypothetical protein